MGIVRAFAAGLRALARKSSNERELDDEVHHYLEMSAREKMRGGMSRSDAERAARIELGGIDAAKEGVRWIGWEATVESFWKDVQYALRRLRHTPGFTLVAVMSLALGIGANTAIFSVVNAALIRQLPVRDPAGLFYVRGGGPSQVFSYPDFDEIRRNNTVFSAMTAWGGITVSMGSDENAALASGAIVTGNYFDLLGVHAVLGRVIGPADDVTPGDHPVIVLGDALWQRRFNRDREVIGKELMLNGHRFTVIGVLPPEFHGAEQPVRRDFFVPMMMQAVVRPPRAAYSGEMSPDLLRVRENRWLIALARLKPGVTPSQAAASLVAMMKDQQAAHPDENRNFKVDVAPISKGDPRARTPMVTAARLLMSVVGLVLLIACANVANLLLARATSRAREIAVRLSLGASRARLVRQLLTESVLLSGIGGILGLGLAWATLNALESSPPPVGAVPLAFEFGIDARVLIFTLGLSLVTGVIFGLAPALRASRPQLAPTLKDESFVPNERLRRLNLRHALVVVQVAVSVVLLVSAGLFLRSLQESRSVNPGFDTDRVLTVPLNINLLRYTTAQGRQFYHDAVERVKTIPGVEAASVTRWVPLTGNNSVRSLMVQGGVGVDNATSSENAGGRGDRNSTIAQVVGVGYFQTIGIALLRGRDFNDNDAGDRPPVAIVNQAFVTQHLKGDPIGQHISMNGAKGPWFEIVGIAADSKLMSVSEAPAGNVYLPVLQNHETGMTLLVRSRRDPALLAPAVTREVHALEKSLPTADARSLARLLDVSLYASRAGTWALTIFGSLALFLASLGLYGVMSYAVARRAKEIGLRMALGARGADVLRQILREGMLLVILGVGVGLALAAGSTRLLESFLFGVSSRDTLTFVATPVLLASVAFAACYFPARRATRMDPMSVLRQQ